MPLFLQVDLFQQQTAKSKLSTAQKNQTYVQNRGACCHISMRAMILFILLHFWLLQINAIIVFNHHILHIKYDAANVH